MHEHPVLDATPLAGTGLDLAAAAALGFLGSTHCLGMCGPLVTLFAARLPAPGEPGARALALRQHALYNLGRVLAYVSAGLVLGSLGGLARLRPAVGALVGLVAGSTVVAVGLGFLRWGQAEAAFPGWLARLTAPAARAWRALLTLARSPGVVTLGGLHALLPCPLLAAAFASALALGDPLRAAAFLAVFGLATVPAVAAIGWLSGRAAPRHRPWAVRVFGVVLVGWGLVLVLHGAGALGGNEHGGHAHHEHGAATGEPGARLRPGPGDASWRG